MNLRALALSLALLAAAPSPGAGAASLPISEGQITALVGQEVQSRRQIPAADVKVTWKDLRLESLLPALPEGPVTLKLGEQVRMEGLGNVPVQILVNGVKYRTIFPKLEVAITQTVLVAKAALEHGKPVPPAAVEKKRQALVGALNGDPVTELSALAGAEPVRDVPAGTVLTTAMFKLSPAIKRGEPVSVTLSSGELTLIISATAASDAASGQLVKLVNPESQKEFTARATGPGRASVALEALE